MARAMVATVCFGILPSRTERAAGESQTKHEPTRNHGGPGAHFATVSLRLLRDQHRERGVSARPDGLTRHLHDNRSIGQIFSHALHAVSPLFSGRQKCSALATRRQAGAVPGTSAPTTAALLIKSASFSLNVANAAFDRQQH